MALEYCIDMKDGDLKGGTVCVPIPVQRFPWPWWVEILRHIEDPEPSPWVLDSQLDQVVMQDLAVLAVVDRLADSLSSQARRGVKQQMKLVIEQLELPEGRRVQHR